MKPGSGLHLKTFFLLLIMVVFGPLGDVLLSKGMKDLGEIPNWSPAELAHLFVGVFTLRHDLARNLLAHRVFHRLHARAFLG